jgi:hypothetical protein
VHEPVDGDVERQQLGHGQHLHVHGGLSGEATA